MRHLRLLAAATAYFGLATHPGSAEAQASFRGLGTPPGPQAHSWAFSASEDGSVVVGGVFDKGCFSTGYCIYLDWEAFRWEAGAYAPLGFLPGTGIAPESVSYAVSGDGRTIVGQSTANQSDVQPFLWRDWVMVGLGGFPGATMGRAFGVSADGSVVVGGSANSTTAHAVRWEDGVMSDLGSLLGSSGTSVAKATSADGAFTVGESATPNGRLEAFLWHDGTMLGLGDLVGGAFDSHATDVSADGSVVVGWSETDSGIEAFRWADGALEGLGRMGWQGAGSLARSVSGDGRIVVGDLSVEFSRYGFLWEPDHGMRLFEDVLRVDFGLVLWGWQLGAVSHVSQDGRIFVGEGWHLGKTEGWIAILPVGCADGIDDDNDGLTDLEDPGCAKASDYSEKSPELPCDDGRDDDEDERFDFPEDPGCATPWHPLENPECDDWIDNDGDGLADADDPVCRDRPWYSSEERRTGCGLGAELGVVLPLLLGLWRRRAR